MYIVHVHVGQPIAWCIADGTLGEIVAAFLNSVNSVHIVMTGDGTSIQCVCNRYTYTQL